MAGILIYVPGAEALKPQERLPTLERLGLAGYHDKALTLKTSPPIPGPDGGTGVLFHWSSNERRERFPLPIYKPAWQTWVPCAGQAELAQGRAWIGWLTSRRPTPDDLLRTRPRLSPPPRGTYLKLHDENDWLFPIARHLPQRIGLDDEGEVFGVVTPRYAPLYEAAYRSPQWFADSTGSHPQCVEVVQAFEFAAEALSVNYRVGRDLVGALQLISTDMLFEVCAAVAEYELLARMAAVVR